METEHTKRFAGLDEALALARRVHSLHDARDGRPYFDHVAAVLERTDIVIALIPAERLGAWEAEAARILAVLHDIVEERDHTGISAGDLLALGFDPRIVAWVVRLSSRPPGVSYQENILALASEPDLPPILVKLADNDHNMAPERIAALPPEERSILRRYERSSPVLAGEVARRTGAEIALPLRARAAEPVPVPAPGP